MTTTGTQRLRRQSISSKRTRQSIKTIEAYFGTAIGGHTGNNTSSEAILSKRKLGKDNGRDLGETDKR